MASLLALAKLMASVMRMPGLPLLVIQHIFILNVALVLILFTLLVSGLLLSIGMLLILPWRCLITLTFGLLEKKRTSLSLVGFWLLVLVFSYLPQKLVLMA